LDSGSVAAKKVVSELEEKIGFAKDSRSYKSLITNTIDAFDQFPMVDGPRRPRVGLVGEILVKFQPDANNHVIDVIEQEGCEAVMPGLLDFFLYSIYNPIWRAENLGRSAFGAFVSQRLIDIIEGYRKHIVKKLKASGKFQVPVDIRLLSEKAETILSCGNACGEGWFLTAEMLELIESGVPNIVCAQPFACLPNHVTGKGMIKELRRQYPQSNIVPIDYDPGASEANQLNRIKLMISTALLIHERDHSDDDDIIHNAESERRNEPKALQKTSDAFAVSPEGVS